MKDLLRKLMSGGGHFLASGRALSQVLYCNVIAHLLRNLEYVLKRSRTKCAMTGLNIHTHVRDIASLVFLGDGVRRSGDWFVGCLEVRRSRGQYIENQPSPQPSRIGEGVNIGGQSGVSHEIDCHPELVSGSHKMQQHRGQSDVQKMLKRVQHDGNNFLKRTYSPRKRCAFTLAEVLITLGVIGVVAAMTMPSLIANYQKKVWVNQLKKSVSVLEQGFQKMLADDGVDDLRDTAVFSFTASDAVDCTTYAYGLDSGCTHFYNAWKKYFNIIDISKTPDYKYYFLDSKDYDDMSMDQPLKFADGMWVNPSYIEMTNDLGYIIIDVNGGKRPNMYGRDIFYFRLSRNGRLVPDGNSDNCKKGDSGDNCATRIIENGWVMDY